MKTKLKNVYLPPETKCNRVELESTVCVASVSEEMGDVTVTIDQQEDAGSFDASNSIDFEWK